MKHPRPSRIHFLAVILACACAISAVSQQSKTAPPWASCFNDSNRNVHYRALREIEDPSTHQSWLLMQDQERAAGPALFVRELRPSACALFSSETSNIPSSFPKRSVQLPIIHAGDPVILSAHTTVSDAELEATALEPAAAGNTLRVRLKFGGFIARSIATAPGRVILAYEASGSKP